MMRRVGHPAPVSIAVFAAMFACAAVAEEPQKPLPFELFHGATTFPEAGEEAAPSKETQDPSDSHAGSPSGHQTVTDMDQASTDGQQPMAVEGVQAPYSEPNQEAGLEMGDKMEVLEPYKLVRSLQFVQDAVVQGDHSAMEMQRFLIGVIDSRLREAEQDVFDDPRNVDAALIYAMSGGNPATLDILAIKDKFGNFDNEVTTVLRAYLNGRAAKTQTELTDVVEIYLSLIHI